MYVLEIKLKVNKKWKANEMLLDIMNKLSTGIESDTKAIEAGSYHYNMNHQSSIEPFNPR